MKFRNKDDGREARATDLAAKTAEKARVVEKDRSDRAASLAEDQSELARLLAQERTEIARILAKELRVFKREQRILYGLTFLALIITLIVK